MGKTLRQLGVSTDPSHRVAEAWGVLGTSFIPAQVSDCRAAKATRLQRNNPGAGFSEASEGHTALRGACPNAWVRPGIPGHTRPLIPNILLMGSCLKASVLLLSQTIPGQEVAPGHSEGTGQSRGVSGPSRPPWFLSFSGLRGPSTEVPGFLGLPEESHRGRQVHTGCGEHSPSCRRRAGFLETPARGEPLLLRVGGHPSSTA